MIWGAGLLAKGTSWPHLAHGLGSAKYFARFRRRGNMLVRCLQYRKLARDLFWRCVNGRGFHLKRRVGVGSYGLNRRRGVERRASGYIRRIVSGVQRLRNDCWFRTRAERAFRRRRFIQRRRVRHNNFALQRATGRHFNSVAGVRHGSLGRGVLQDGRYFGWRTFRRNDRLLLFADLCLVL